MPPFATCLFVFSLLPSFFKYSENGCVDASWTSPKTKQQNGAWGRAPLTVANCRPDVHQVMDVRVFEWKLPAQALSPLRLCLYVLPVHFCLLTRKVTGWCCIALGWVATKEPTSILHLPQPHFCISLDNLNTKSCFLLATYLSTAPRSTLRVHAVGGINTSEIQFLPHTHSPPSLQL